MDKVCEKKLHQHLCFLKGSGLYNLLYYMHAFTRRDIMTLKTKKEFQAETAEILTKRALHTKES